MSAPPILFLTVGLPGCGKTTAARRFEAEHAALRLTKDEWMKALYVADNPSSASDVIEGRLITIALRAVTVGTNVALDFGLWSRHERSALRYAGDKAGAAVVMWYAPISPEEQQRRNTIRLATDPHTTWPMSERRAQNMGAKLRRTDTWRTRWHRADRSATCRVRHMAGLDATSLASHS